MYERFTDRARKVMLMANQEAQRLNHEYIGTEHLLLGLIKEGSGIAANVLKNLDIDLRNIRLEVERLVQSGPDMVTMGKLPQTPRAKKVVEYSMEESRNLNHNYVGTEHILLGMLREDEGIAGVVLLNFGLTPEIARDMTLAVLRHGIGGTNRGIPNALKSTAPPYPNEQADEMERLQSQKEEAIVRLDFEKAAAFRDQIEEIKKAVLRAKMDELKQKIKSQMIEAQNPGKTESKPQSKPLSLFSRFTDRARKVMQLANQEAQRFNHEYIGTEHVLLGLIKEGSGVAANVLKNLNIDLRKIRLEVEKLIQSGPDMVTMGKLPQTPRAKKVIEYSMEEARNLNHDYVGTEHILLGLLREKEAVAAQVLMNLGLKLGNVRAEVLAILGHGISASNRDIPDSTKMLEILGMLFPPEILREIDRLQTEKAAAVESQDFESAAVLRNRIVDLIKKFTDRNWKDKIGPYKPEIESLLRRINEAETPLPSPVPEPNDSQSRLAKRARLVMRRANREAVLRGAEYVGSEHVLLALIDLASGITRKVFKNFDVDRQKIRTEIEKHIQSGPKTAAFRKLPQTPRVKQVIQYSVEEAKNTTGDLVDSEHILLGLLRGRKRRGASAIQPWPDAYAGTPRSAEVVARMTKLALRWPRVGSTNKKAGTRSQETRPRWFLLAARFACVFTAGDCRRAKQTVYFANL